MEAQRVTWPSNVRNLPWPKTGITYSYENRGYVHPEKLKCWLEKAFGGRDKADYRVSRAICVVQNSAVRGPMPTPWLRSLPDVLCSVHFRLIPYTYLPNLCSCRSYDLSQADEYHWQLLHGRIYIKAPREPTAVSSDKPFSGSQVLKLAKALLSGQMC